MATRPTMETNTKPPRPSAGQLISVPHKDTMRLLDVYVKRSISLNDGTLRSKRPPGKEKWVTMPRKLRRHSSDTALHLGGGLNDGKIGTFSAVEPEQPETRPVESEKPAKKPKKNKKPSLWKSFLGIFSRRGSGEEKDDEQDGPPPILEGPSGAEASDSGDVSAPTPTVKRKKSSRSRSIRRRFSKRGITPTKPNRAGRDLTHADITRVEAVSVEPTYNYYEKVTEELEKIVHEVQIKEEVERLSDEEVIERIIALTKVEGDAIDDKLKDYPGLSNFFTGMSYSCFQKLADAYLEAEASPAHNPPSVLPTAPELVKLAFTLDFTARIAGLSKQNVGHITGLGYRYLQDRFEYQQACSDHPGSDSDD
ncbi:Apoptosis facilitator Bcl-2-like protein 14 [Liparis tanakae]|uniref:Apoptosis facilitator Bcl-2-like protein 14 n=1 Tax=Liparis tanakae TaxID=230148 RepID=A0A4Z2IFN7_9TELE|nr:Apoptosis facilitator Bcl-2-like protein 14 [Liparis tanakae]